MAVDGKGMEGREQLVCLLILNEAKWDVRVYVIYHGPIAAETEYEFKSSKQATVADASRPHSSLAETPCAFQTNNVLELSSVNSG